MVPRLTSIQHLSAQDDKLDFFPSDTTCTIHFGNPKSKVRWVSAVCVPPLTFAVNPIHNLPSIVIYAEIKNFDAY